MVLPWIQWQRNDWMQQLQLWRPDHTIFAIFATIISNHSNASESIECACIIDSIVIATVGFNHSNAFSSIVSAWTLSMLVHLFISLHGCSCLR